MLIAAKFSLRDLENTPNDLRNILERALGEDASVTSLDKFLPRIREIIINLLQGLKRKQQIHRMQSGEAAAPSRTRKADSQANHQSAGSSSLYDARQQSASPTGSNHRVNSPSPYIPAPVGSTTPSPSKRQLPSLPGITNDHTMMRPSRNAPEPPSVPKEGYSIAPPIPAHSDPVVQLSQMNLERRSSKRFSENYLAQLISSPNSDRQSKLSVDGVRKNLQKSMSIPEAIEDETEAEAQDYSASRAYGGSPVNPSLGNKPRSIPHQPDSPSLPSPAFINNTNSSDRSANLDNQDPAQTVHDNVKSVPEPVTTRFIFVKNGDLTKKLTLNGEITIDRLIDCISIIYDVSRDVTLYIEDAESKVAYELEDVEDIKQRSVLIINPARQPEKPDGQDKSMTDGIADLRNWLTGQLLTLSSEIQELRKTPVNATSEPQDMGEKSTIDKAIRDDRVIPLESHGSKENDLLVRLAASEEDNQKLKDQITNLQNTIPKRASAEGSPSVVSVNRENVMSMSAKHEHRGTLLTAKLEEAMNSMERIRKDVLQRKVTPRPQQLADLSKEFDEVQAEANALADNLVTLDATSNKLWEEELTVITTEQETLEYQRMFLDDIKADLEQSLSSLSTIKQVEEQKRLTPVGAVPMIVETAADPSRALKFVQADIKSLQVNHERRAAAIADAEKQRVKEREYLMENEFKKELGSFVGSNALKSTGGASEIDRLREEKDEAHRKQLFSPPSTPQEESVPTINTEVSKTTSSASILARINASQATDVLEKRRSSLIIRHGSPFDKIPSEEERNDTKRLSTGKEEAGDVTTGTSTGALKPVDTIEHIPEEGDL